ncbi:hypothetical protein [Haloactinomyces albus]|uniref:Uncharacterized protein n=1 Tax=Haloactinomyces albus TaxID=1352928 RepID=A0AAE3ZD18_9ACTN|nr:hypothetical protein [Haloactinomyces albus]MDR7301418.1 hypothetical protein [Haloactinomyces albus]
MSTESHIKPHMYRRGGETEAERVARCARSCYRCGHEEPEALVLDAHEAVCDGIRPDERGQHR